MLSFLVALLVATPAIAFGSFACITAGRLLPGIRWLVAHNIKPFACDPCASVWGGALGAGALAYWAHELWYCIIAVPAAGLCMFMMAKYRLMAEPPPMEPPKAL